MHNLKTLLYILLGLILLSQLGFTWGAYGHIHITASAIEDLPYNMATTFRPVSTWLANTSTDAGVRTGWDPNETDFHYIDTDQTPPGYTWPFTSVPRDRATYLSQYGSYGSGVNPYALDSITIVLSTAYRIWGTNPTASNFTTCLYWMTRVSHYCADLHQPLHVTVNYNDSHYVHEVYESTTLNNYTPTVSSALNSGTIYRADTSGTYKGRTIQFEFSIISTSYPYYPKIYQAETTAYNIAHSYSNTTFYYSLWTSTQSFTTTLLNLAAKDVASLWYTAWIDAGLPVVSVPVELSEFYSTLDIPVNKQ